MANHASSISFPAHTVGRQAITDVLVRTFGQTYESVYSFYLGCPSGEVKAFSCGWFSGHVGETEQIRARGLWSV